VRIESIAHNCALRIARRTASSAEQTVTEEGHTGGLGSGEEALNESEADVTESILPRARSFTAVPPFTSLTASRQLAVSSQQVGTRQSSTKTFARRPLRLLAGVSRLLSSQTKSVPHR